MSVSKTDFKTMSEAMEHASPMFKEGLTPAARDARMKQWREDVNAIAAVFKLSNPRFDYKTFIKACGVPPEENHSAS